jgi:hypothetical protein
MNAFHSGCIGDIIYSIPTMQALGVTNLYVDDRPWTKPIVNRIGVFARLIEAQGILVKKHEGEDINVDLSTYRNGGMIYGDTIANRVARWVGAKIDLSKPWRRKSHLIFSDFIFESCAVLVPNLCRLAVFKKKTL